MVYRAYQTSVGREVAVKVILPQYANEPDFVRRFEVEAQLVARLEHPHIVPMFDYWRDPAGAYLVMRWLPANLRSAMERGVWSPTATARFLDQVAAALTVAHRDNVIHRDIKPENILLDEDENAYLADFSIARDLSLRNSADSQGMSGTPAYRSPEQIRNEPVTARTDIYSLGYVLYELLTGESAYRDATTPDDYIDRHLTTPLPSLGEHRAQLPAALDGVLQTATAKDPAQRYANALRFAAAFRAALPTVSQRLARQPLADPLTERELDVLRLMVLGLANEQIAERLVLSPGTVKWYVKQIYQKLDSHSRHQAIERAQNLGLVEQADGRPAPGAAADIAPIHPKAAIPIQEPMNPYKGLRAFQEADAPDFFGRAAMIERLLNRLSEQEEGARFLAVVGPSGSGKSSLIKAGLLPALRQGTLATLQHPFIAEMMPGSHPFEELEAALLRTSVNPIPGLLDQLRKDRRGLVRAAKRILPVDPSTELVLVIDQFEELFVLVEDEEMRAHFINNLLSAVGDPRGRTHIILTLRADFYDRPLLYPRLAELVRSNTEVVVPLSPRELEQAIIAPVERCGVHLETGLTATIINDVGEQPGMLPLLQYALTELFEQREGLTLTLDAYHATGGVSGALTRRADEVYRHLNGADQRLARQLFLRLVTLGEGTEDTRRRTLLGELTALGAEGSMEDVISAFADYRLLTLDRDPVTHTPTVEIAHEALVRQWGQLLAWLTVSREDIRLQRRLAQATVEWNVGGDRSFLASGVRLAQFENWASDTDLALTTVERDYLDASLVERRRTEQIEAERQANERRLEHRSRTWLRALVVVLLLATLGAFGLTGVAVNQSNVAQASFQRAEAQRLAAESGSALRENTSTELAALLAIRSMRHQYTPQGDAALVAAALLEYPVRGFVGHTDRIKAVDYSPDGRYILTGSGDSTVRLWEVQTGREVRQFSGDMQDINSAVFSPDGQTILTGSRHDHTMRLWDVESGEELKRFSEGNGGIFSADGQELFVFSEERAESYMLDLATGDVLHTIPGPQVWRRPETPGYSPDGTLFVDVPLDEGLVHLRRVDTGEEILSFPISSQFENFAFSSDNRIFAITEDDGAVDLWDLSTGELIHSLPADAQGEVISMAFSSDNQLLVTGGADSSVRVWNVQTGAELRRFTGHTLPVRIVDFSPDGRFVLSGSFDQRALLWELAPPAVLPNLDIENHDLTYLLVSPDGTRMATSRDDGTTMVWDLMTGELVHRLQAGSAPIWHAGFSPDSSLLLTASDQVQVWNMADGSLMRDFPQLAGVVDVGTPINWIEVFSEVVISAHEGDADWSGGVIVWSIASGEEVRRYPTPSGVVAAMLSPNGQYLLAQTTPDRLFRVIDAVTGEELHTFHIVNSFSVGHFNAFSPDSQTFFTGGNVVSALWDLRSGELLHELIGHQDIVFSSAFSHDGDWLVTSSFDKTVRLWNVETGQEIRRITLPFTPQYTNFTADAATIILLGDDGKVHFFDTGVDETIHTVCARLIRDFTPEERAQYEIADDTPTCPL
ncbi:MAG: protein kinase [Chloroflexi bacterium]|nr:protein kinase [Chloroflexota bacterium]